MSPIQYAQPQVTTVPYLWLWVSFACSHNTQKRGFLTLYITYDSLHHTHRTYSRVSSSWSAMYATIPRTQEGRGVTVCVCVCVTLDVGNVYV
jgi:hypothetical protein